MFIMNQKVSKYLDAVQQLRVLSFGLMTDKEVESVYQSAASRVGSACGEFLSVCHLIDFDKANDIFVSNITK